MLHWIIPDMKPEIELNKICIEIINLRYYHEATKLRYSHATNMLIKQLTLSKTFKEQKALGNILIYKNL